MTSVTPTESSVKSSAWWDSLWKNGTTPWDIGQSTPALRKLIDSGEVPPTKGRAFVPGCGRGYDVLALASSGCHTIGLDLSPAAIKEAEKLRDSKGISAEHAEFHSGDFFKFKSEEKFDFIFDYTFLCAMPPEWRKDWASKMFDLLKDDGELFTLIFPVIDKEGGPPYAMSPDLLKEILEPAGFKSKALYPSKDSVPDREGKEWIGRWVKTNQ